MNEFPSCAHRATSLAAMQTPNAVVLDAVRRLSARSFASTRRATDNVDDFRRRRRRRRHRASHKTQYTRTHTGLNTTTVREVVDLVNAYFLSL